MSDTQHPNTPRFVTDKELAPPLRVSVGWLQRDRITAQRIPFVRLGDRCLYDVDDAFAAVKAMSVGGRSAKQRALAGKLKQIGKVP